MRAFKLRLRFNRWAEPSRAIGMYFLFAFGAVILVLVIAGIASL